MKKFHIAMDKDLPLMYIEPAEYAPDDWDNTITIPFACLPREQALEQFFDTIFDLIKKHGIIQLETYGHQLKRQRKKSHKC